MSSSSSSWASKTNGGGGGSGSSKDRYNNDRGSSSSSSSSSNRDRPSTSKGPSSSFYKKNMVCDVPVKAWHKPMRIDQPWFKPLNKQVDSSYLYAEYDTPEVSRRIFNQVKQKEDMGYFSDSR